MPRPDKVAVVEEIQARLASSHAAVLTEYRGLSVPDLARLRATLREAGSVYKVYKNTLVRRAADAAGIDGGLEEKLVGPTAFAFIDQGDVVATAKALRDFSRTNESLVIKGGLLDGEFLSAEKVAELADLPSRDELIAKIAGGFKAPMFKAAGLFSALQRNTAYALKALIDKRVEAGEAPPPDDTEAQADAPAAVDSEAPAADESETAEESEAPETTDAEEGSESASASASEAEDSSENAESSTAESVAEEADSESRENDDDQEEPTSG